MVRDCLVFLLLLAGLFMPVTPNNCVALSHVFVTMWHGVAPTISHIEKLRESFSLSSVPSTLVLARCVALITGTNRVNYVPYAAAIWVFMIRYNFID